MQDETIEKAAKQLYEAQINSKTCVPVRQLIGESDILTAYKIQEINIQKRMIAENTEIVGRKIGLTAKAVQQQLGVDQPDFGTLLGNMQIKDKGSIAWNELVQPKAEAEIAFILKEDVREKISTSDLADTIDYAVACIEVVGSRVENWDIKITDTIADNASASHFVLGESKKKISQLDLENCKMQMYKNGEMVSEGIGSVCLGSPLNSYKWLADKMIEMETPLLAGDVVLTGALGKMAEGKAGDNFKAEIEGLGTVEVTFGKENQ